MTIIFCAFENVVCNISAIFCCSQWGHDFTRMVYTVAYSQNMVNVKLQYVKHICLKIMEGF